MTGLSILLLVAAVGFGLSRWLRIPVIPLLLLPGILLSVFSRHPAGTFLHDTLNPNFLESVIELGLVFLVFAAGIELNPRRIGKQRKAAWWVGMGQFLLTGAFGFLVARWLGFDGLPALYLGLTLSISSTLVVLRQLRSWLRMFEPFARTVTGVLLLQDLLMILCIVALASFSDLDDVARNLDKLAWNLGAVLFLGALAVWAQRFLMPWLILRIRYDSSGRLQLPPGVSARLNEESLLLVLIAVLFVFIGAAKWLGLPLISGAFLAGFSLSSFPLNGVVRSVMDSLSGFFLALFFTALGAVVVVPDTVLLVKGFCLAATVLLFTPPLVTYIAERAGLTSRSAIESGLLLAQTSELSLVLALSGLLLGHISSEIFSLVALVAVVTMTVTPLVAHDQTVGRLLRFHPSRRRSRPSGGHSGHVLMLGFGAGGMWVLKPLLKAGYKVVIVDDDPVVIDQLSRMDVECIRGDGADEKVLEQACARDAKFILASMRRVRDAERLLGRVKNIPVIVRVFENRDARHIRELGGIPVLNSSAALETFTEWFRKSGFAKGEGRKAL